MPFTYPYARPSLTADILLFGFNPSPLKVLLIQRKHDPFAGKWAFPGGFVDENETPEHAALRELQEETGITGIPLRQFHAFGAPGRDPRGWTVSVGHYALVNLATCHPKADDDAAAVDWFPVATPPPLAFDHADVLAKGRAALKARARTHPIGMGVLEETFTIAELQRAYEAALDASIDANAFSKAVLASGLLKAGSSGNVRFEAAAYGLAEETGLGKPLVF